MITALTGRTDFFSLWENFMSTGSTQGVPDKIAASWLRCRNAGIDENDISPMSQLDTNELQKAQKESQELDDLLMAHNKEIEKQYPNVPIAMFCTNSTGHILSVQGHDIILKAIENSPLDIGTCVTEPCIGTSAPSLSIAEKTTSLVIGEEHYFRGFHWASCFAVPFFSFNRKFSGVIDFSSSFRFGKQLEKMIPFLLHIANSIQFELFVKHKLERLKLHEAYFKSTFDYADSMVIITDAEGGNLKINAAARETIFPNTQVAKIRNIQEILSLSSPLKFITEKCVKTSLLKGDSNISLNMEIIPVYDNTGQEKSFILKIAKPVPMGNVYALPAQKKTCFKTLIGRSSCFRNLIWRAKKIAQVPSSVLLEGPTGTGKELLAIGIHQESSYADGPFVAINCSAIPNELVESEFFGYEKRAFTGAGQQGRKGKFEQADKGTLFLDEIHTMGLSTQMKLLRVIEERRVTRVGGASPIDLDLRIIAATSTNLFQEVSQGRFLDALYYRLNIVKLAVPSLKDRKEDIPQLSSHFIDQMNKKMNRTIKGISPCVEKIFREYSWPGNIRELKNCIESACIFCEGPWILPEHLKETSVFENQNRVEESKPEFTIEAMTEKLMRSAYERFGNASDAAHHLGMPKSTFYRKFKKFKMA